MIAMLRMGLWGLLAAAIAVGGVGYADSTSTPLARPIDVARPAGSGASRVQPALDSLAGALSSLAPFRMSRRATSVPYHPARAVLPAGPVLPRPTLSLRGILWGSRPAAAIEGVPGVSGDRLFTVGDTLGGLRIRRIERTRVTITGFDTTWVLLLPPPTL